jgi:hypothetical protein
MGSLRLRHSTRAHRAPSVSVPPKASKPPALEQSALTDIVMRLKIVYAVIICAANALRHQDCEVDVEVASMLRHCASDPLNELTEKLAAIAGQVRS